MDKKEIKDYLKRVDKLLDKLKGEDKETLSWLIYGYNQCAKLLNEAQKENQKLKAELQLYKGSLKREHEAIHRVNDLEKVIDEAIKRLEKGIFIIPKDTNELLDILKGVDND